MELINAFMEVVTIAAAGIYLTAALVVGLLVACLAVYAIKSVLKSIFDIY